MPQISVIVPVYNSEQFLCQCVDSILHQTFSDIELILVDDGSPDGCPAICDAYTAQDNRVRVIHKQNAGVAAARNTGLDAAHGEYITFVDSDDYIDPNMYESMMQKARQWDCDVVMCDCLKEFPYRSTPYSHAIRGGYYNQAQLREEYYPHLLMMENMEYPPTISNWLILFRYKQGSSCQLRYVNGIRYSEDLLFGAQVLYQANSFYYLKGQTHYHYRMNPQSATHKFVLDKWNDYERLHQKIQETFGNCTDYDFHSQIDRCLLFFVYNAVGDIMRTNQLHHHEKVDKVKKILGTPDVRDMFGRLTISELPISSKLKITTYLYKYQIGIGMLCRYYGKCA